MLKTFAGAAFAAAVTVAAPAAAVVYIVPLGAIVVPPTQTFTPGQTFLTAGANGADIQFTISQANTWTVSSFTNSSIGGTGVFDFTSVALYAGTLTTGTPLQTGSVTVDGNTRRASLSQYNLNFGTYTIAYRGSVTGEPAGVGSNLTFAAGSAVTAVPEPASWAMMALGLGGMGYAMRRRPQFSRTRIRFS